MNKYKFYGVRLNGRKYGIEKFYEEPLEDLSKVTIEFDRFMRLYKVGFKTGEKGKQRLYIVRKSTFDYLVQEAENIPNKNEYYSRQEPSKPEDFKELKDRE